MKKPTASYKRLNRVIDSLYLRVGKSVGALFPSQWLRSELPRWRGYKATAEFGDSELEVTLPTSGLTFYLMRGTKRPFLYWLQHEEIGDIFVWNPQGWSSRGCRQTGALMFDFRSVTLQTRGIEFVEAFVAGVCKDFFQHIPDDLWGRVSRIDLAVDIQTPEGLRISELDQFVSRSRKRDLNPEYNEQLRRAYEQLAPHRCNKGGSNPTNSLNDPKKSEPQASAPTLTEKDFRALDVLLDRIKDELEGAISRTLFNPEEKVQTIYFGLKTNPVYARIYNKTDEIEYSGKSYMRDIWIENGWDQESPVYRVEFSLSSDFLKEAAASDILSETEGEDFYDLRDFDKCLECLPSLWNYLTIAWLRRLQRSGVQDTDKGATHKWWQVIQGAWPRSKPAYRMRTYAPDPEELMAQLKGLLVTISAKKCDDRDLTKAAEMIEDIEAFIFSDEFLEKYPERRKRLGLADCATWDSEYPGDAEFTARLRGDRMKEGKGS